MTKSAYQKLCSLFLLTFVLVHLCAATTPSSVAQKQGQVCGDPTAKCSTSYPFGPHDLPFVIKGEIEFKEYESNFFYAVILKSIKAEKGDGDCSFVPEKERLEVQRLLPNNKVFASRFHCPECLIFYDGVNSDYNILAVYGGATKSEAEKILQQVKSRYPDANIRRTRVFITIT